MRSVAGRSAATAVSVCALAALFALPNPTAAPGAYDPVASGSTTIVLAKPFRKLLAQNHIRLLQGGKDRLGSRKLVLPATGGEVDPVLGTGTVETAEPVVFAAAGRRLPFRQVTFKAKRAPLYAKVGGGRLKIATATGLRSRRNGFGASITATGLRLTAKAATRLDKKLRLDGVLRQGQLIGTVEAVAQPATVHLREEGRVSLALDQGFKQKLDGLFVSVNPIAPAELGAGPTLTFPVGLDSTLAPDATSGTIKLGGSIELLQLGNAQIFWREVWLQPGGGALLAETDVEPSPPHPGKQPQAQLFSLPPGAVVVSDPPSRAITLSGQAVVLTAAAANTLNDAFAKTQAVFSEGEAVGSLSFSATGG